MASPELCTFDNGAGGNTWETALNWDVGHAPVSGDWVSIEADCTCSTDESANVLSGGASQITAGNTLTIATNGNVYVQNQNLTIAATATLAFTGGNLRLTSTGGQFYLYLYGGITADATANSKIECSASGDGGVRIQWKADASIAANAANRLEIEGDTGASVARHDVNSFNAVVQNVNMHGQSRFYCDKTVALENCLIHDSTSGEGAIHDSGYVSARDCWFYGNTYGMEISGIVDCENCVFGENEAAGADANTSGDLLVAALHGGRGRFNNCKLSSATELVFASANVPADIVMNAYDQDVDDWKEYQGIGHYATREVGAGAQGGSGTAVALVSHANCAAGDRSMFRRLVATIPLDTSSKTKIDATLYIKGTNAKTAVLRIDPDGIFGTTQAYNETADGNWNQRTIPQYTVSGSIGKVCVPIYLDITGASETWYYDTLEYTLS